MTHIDWLTLRVEAGLTQRETAHRAGIAESSYNGYENNHHVPKFYTVIDLLEVFGYTLTLEKVAQ